MDSSDKSIPNSELSRVKEFVNSKYRPHSNFHLSYYNFCIAMNLNPRSDDSHTLYNTFEAELQMIHFKTFFESNKTKEFFVDTFSSNEIIKRTEERIIFSKAQSENFFPNKSFNKNDFFQTNFSIDKDTLNSKYFNNSLIIDFIPEHVKYITLYNRFNSIDGLVSLTLLPSSLSIYNNICKRSGVIKYSECTQCELAISKMDRMEIDLLDEVKATTSPVTDIIDTISSKKFYLSVLPYPTPLGSSSYIIPAPYEISTSQDRLEVDIKLAEKLMLKLDKEKHLNTNPIMEHAILNSDDLTLLEKLDILIIYLRKVHLFCYYCVKEFEFEEDLWNKCGLNPHPRSTPSTETDANNSINSSGTTTYAWFTGAFYDTKIRYYIDNEETPSIDAELYNLHMIGFGDEGAFFGNQIFGKNAKGGGIYSTIRIPFTKHIKVTGQLDHEVANVFWFIIRGLDGMGATVGDFLLPSNARLRLSRVDNVTVDVLGFTTLAESKKSGMLYSVFLEVVSKDLNFLEACVRAYIDGSSDPTFLSSGTEDFFNSAFYYNMGTFQNDIAGLINKNTQKNPNEISMYKLFWKDPVLWKDGFKLVWRNMEDNSCPTAWPYPKVAPTYPPTLPPNTAKMTYTGYTLIYEW